MYEPFAGDPFYDTVTLSSEATSVTVEAINCKGQRVKKTVAE